MKTEAVLDRSPAAFATPSQVSDGVARSMKIEFVDPRSEPQWDQWVGSHPGSGVFHSTGWAKVLTKTYGHEPFYLRISNDDQTIALVPMMEIRSRLTGRRGVCLPFSDCCGPLIFDRAGDAAILESLAAVARERKWKYFEVRGPISSATGATPSVEFFGHTLSLNAGSESIFAALASPVRRAIRKAEKSGVTARISRSPEAIEDFYRLHVRTRRHHGIPTQPLAFFRNIHDEIIRAGNGFTVLAWNADRPVAGAVFLQFGKKALYKFGASIGEGQEVRANNLVMWEAIQFLAGRGFETLDFGRTSRVNEGLRHFKQGWGTREHALDYFKFDPSANRWLTSRDHASGFHTAVFRRMPLFANRLAGAMLYPHLD